MKNRDMPAKPVFGSNGILTSHRSMTSIEKMDAMGGLTKLEYLAGHIMANACCNPDFTRSTPQELAAWALKCSNALFDELEKQGGDHG